MNGHWYWLPADQRGARKRTLPLHLARAGVVIRTFGKRLSVRWGVLSIRRYVVYRAENLVDGPDNPGYQAIFDGLWRAD